MRELLSGHRIQDQPKVASSTSSRRAGERQAITAQLTALASHTARHGNDPTLLDQLPELTTRIDELPGRIQAGLLAFDIQILWNPPPRQATFRATITDTTPGIVASLLTSAGDDPATAASTGTTSAPGPVPVTSHDTFSVSPRTGIPVRGETEKGAAVGSSSSGQPNCRPGIPSAASVTGRAG